MIAATVFVDTDPERLAGLTYDQVADACTDRLSSEPKACGAAFDAYAMAPSHLRDALIRAIDAAR